MRERIPGTFDVFIPICEACARNMRIDWLPGSLERCAFCDSMQRCTFRRAESSNGHAEGAIENGCAIVKVHSEPGDAYPDGTRGTVLGSCGPVDGIFGYWIAWAPRPRVPTFIAGKRIAVAP